MWIEKGPVHRHLVSCPFVMNNVGIAKSLADSQAFTRLRTGIEPIEKQNEVASR